MTSYTPPMCMFCKRLRDGLTCDAFPERIPDAILEGRHDHRTPYKGDSGIIFDPIDEDAARIVAAMFGDTDNGE